MDTPITRLHERIEFYETELFNFYYKTFLGKVGEEK